jgi:hypothetical protein
MAFMAAKGIMTAMDPARRSAVAIVAVVVVAGAALIAGMQAFRGPLVEWLVANPSQTAARVTMVIAATGALLVLPLLAFAAYAWRVAGTIEQARGRGLKTLAALLVGGAVLLAATLWRLNVLMTR